MCQAPGDADVLCMLGAVLRDQGAGWGGMSHKLAHSSAGSKDDTALESQCGLRTGEMASGAGANGRGPSVPARGRGELARLMLDKALLVHPHHIAAHCNKALLLSTEVHWCLPACKLSAKKNGLRLCFSVYASSVSKRSSGWSPRP